MNREIFYDEIRNKVNLTTQNVVGFEKVLDYMEQREVGLEDGAYALATAFWETAQTMHPVVEAYWLSESWRKKNLRYYPWHGRGLIQTTWKQNYITMGKELGVDFTKNPDLLLEWEWALPALFVGMEKGLYTGKALDDYLDGEIESDNEQMREYANARRIVNGTDKQIKIAELALTFQKALQASGYTLERAEPVTESVPAPKPDVPTSEPKTSLVGFLLQFILSLFGAKK